MRRLILATVTVSIGAVLAWSALAQENAEPGGRETAAREPPETPDIVVRGKRVGQLRIEIQRAEEAVFARFNELNSTDEFDIHCHRDKVGRLVQRFCMSNAWRKQDGNIARATVLAMRGQGSGTEAMLYRDEQLRKQRLLSDEMRQLAAEDSQLREAIAELSEAQIALLTRVGNKTLSRKVTAMAGSLPHGAKLMFEVIMGNDAWRHRLTEARFTISDVLGEVRKLELDCAEGNRRIDYEIGADWTVPAGWRSCTVQVSAKKTTTFKLYEF